MKEEGKTYYEAPATAILDVIIEGVVCQSGGAGVQDYGWHEYEEE